jgi:NAD(P)-dependent dehydrogenase (short-subunit alcohol dehydrogenase family)
MTSQHAFIVTGAASGIGHATAARLVERGHRVLSLDIKQPAAEVAGHSSCDLSDPASIDAALSGIKEPISALLNIAGVPGTVGAETTMRVNLLGLRHLTEGLWNRIADRGRIVNVASIAGNNWRKRRGALTALLSTPDFAAGLAWWQANGSGVGTDAYTFSKEAVVLYTMQLAGRGLARGIRVNDVGPGPIDTPIFPDFEQMTGREMMQSYISMVGRVGKPDDIAEAITMLAEGEIGWINGQHIVVDGGLTAGFSAGWKSGRSYA